MYDYPSVEKVQVKMLTNVSEELPGHFTGENERNVPRFRFYLSIHQ